MMAEFKNLFQSADFKSEKHVPVIKSADKLKEGETLEITVSVGKEIPHPNTTEHHICWVEVYFLPRAEKFPYQIGKAEFSAHGGSVQGPNTSAIYAQPVVTFSMKTEKSGTLFAVAYCNIHGLWENSRELILE